MAGVLALTKEIASQPHLWRRMLSLIQGADCPPDQGG